MSVLGDDYSIMPRLLLTVFAFLLCLVGHLPVAQGETNMLWYAQPAAKWTDALPIGNGRLGAMIFGGVNDEHIQFNEDTLWTGQPHDYVRAGAGDQLAEIRQLLADGKNKDAVVLARAKFLSDPIRQKAYQPFGDLHLHFTIPDEVTNYCRQLDLDTAIAGVSFRAGGVIFKREIFASYPDQAIVWRVSADQPGKVSFTLIMDSPHTNSHTAALARDTLSLTGQVEAGGLKFESRVRVASEGGSITTHGNVIIVTNANSATLYLVAATGFKNFQDISGNPAKICAKDLKHVGDENFVAARATHLEDYQNLFGSREPGFRPHRCR